MQPHGRMAVQWLLFGLLLPSAGCISDLSSTDKRGLAFHGDEHESDNELLLSKNSTIAWYYTWSLFNSQGVGDTITFVPLIHGLDDASSSDLRSQLNSLPSSSTQLLTFNEPDGGTNTGGSSISPEDAARSYMSNIAPLRKSTDVQSRNWSISYPSVTGSSRGLDWLRDFNESCFEMNDDGCPMDFVAVHWYGEFSGLMSWIDTLRGFYNATAPDAEYWITEMALPKADEKATFSMMNESLQYLDSLDFVKAYAWFGAFRSDEANEWTGDNVSLFDGDGDLTELGALYLGGDERGFKEGMSAGGVYLSPSHALMLGIFTVVAWLMQ
ncbi:Fc.00g104880.m01.CDS01 [Cosmosporella sp. VM-42]